MKMPAKSPKKGPRPGPKIAPEMRDYIQNSISELRICTTCEGPVLLPVRLSPPKPMDVKIDVEGRTLYISAVQAPRIKTIDGRMLPKCVLQKRKKCL
ncbi:MAG: Uncharacterized protein XD72_1607 [Methanothrix harundinacea]|uniref:Uncharacterized protein n=1 Tax=Methanothrix harundinacea TaxID=301375 RepID=A0A101FT72_9EURY|nr:MAG: Uncharacterized protein XD72_1607 [Methanothrix harundinacea]KUK97764.1 MAG: Uncharacterized protein XE07_0178 [Methanothrix harundinacea]